jgi:hypothetical protein
MILACVCRKKKEEGKKEREKESFIDDLGKWNGNNT